MKFRNLNKNRKAKVNNNSGKMKKFLSKVSGAFMLPISVMAIAGLFLGIGSAIVSNSNSNNLIILKTFGMFIKNLGEPIFGIMPLLFAAAIVVAFTDEAGVAIFVAIIGFVVFSALQTPFIKEYFGPEKSWIPAYKDMDGTIHIRNGSNITLSDIINKGGYKEFADTKSSSPNDIWFKKSQGFSILFGGAGRDPETLKALVGNNLGILSMKTSIFGGIIVGSITSYLYNKYHTIKLPSLISFFNGKRFVPLVVIFFMIPLVFIFLILWPYIGFIIGKLGQASGKSPIGLDSFVFGFIERALIPFGLHHVFYAPLWWTKAGGDLETTIMLMAKKAGVTGSDADTVLNNQLFDTESSQALREILKKGKFGDSSLWVALSQMKINSLTLFNQVIADKIFGSGHGMTLSVFDMFSKGAGLNLGRFMQGKYPIVIFGLPAAAMAMIFAAPKDTRKVAFGAVAPAALTSFATGVTEPIEFSFLFLAPWLFWGFHALMAGLSFMFMEIFGSHIGMPSIFSGGFIDLIIYGMIPFQKGTHFWLAFIVGLPLIPIYFSVFYFSIKNYNLSTPGRGDNVKLIIKKPIKRNKSNENYKDKQKANQIIEGLGDFSNIKKITNCATRLKVDLIDMKKIDEDKLKAAGAIGFMKSSKTHIQCIFGPQVESIAIDIKKLYKPKK
ncbi:MAG: PTS transporter subunit EIIC [Mycoplasma sp.]|nr:PTS transporter subunit EIIC [Mycoplasma sp.]